jgi:hypothetical protein
LTTANRSGQNNVVPGNRNRLILLTLSHLPSKKCGSRELGR